MVDALYHALNVGVVDVDKLHRIDLERMRLAAEDQTNFFCDAVGRMFLRPGFGHVANTYLSAKGKLIPFIAGSSAAYLIELTPGYMRILDCSTDTIITRPSVSTTIQNGTDFAASTGWTLAAKSGQTTAISGNKLTLSARAHGGKAVAYQAVSVAGGDQATEHAIRVNVDNGPVTFRVGTTAGDDDLVSETSLDTGFHSLAFIPNAATFYVQLSTSLPRDVVVSKCQIEAAGAMVLPTIWGGNTETYILQTAQSLDILFCACFGNPPQKIERRGDGVSAGRSWSVAYYRVDDGPFSLSRDADIKITPSATEGNITLTASEPYWETGHVGGLVRIYHDGQRLDTYLAAANEFTDTFTVTGINETDYNERDWVWTISGTWVGTFRWQRSFDGEDSGFHDFRSVTGSGVIDITANAASQTNDENDDNAIAWYRGDMAAYTSGELHVVATYDGGGGTGVARITSRSSSTVVNAEVLTPMKGITGSKDWSLGIWSDYAGYPSGVAFHEGRICWLGDDAFNASVSDAYYSFDENTTGDSGPLFRTIAVGGRNEGRWLLSMTTLFAATDANIAKVGGSSLDEIMTPTNFSAKAVGEVGAEIFQPAKVGQDTAIFVGQSGVALYEISYQPNAADYLVSHLTKLTSSFYEDGITGLATQSLPDTRVWVSIDGATSIMIVYDKAESVFATIPVETASGDRFECFATIPGSTGQDRVYTIAKRLVNGSYEYHIEKLALDIEVKPNAVCKVMDGFVSGTGAHSATISSLDHLEDRTVVAWVDGAPVYDTDGVTPKTFTVSGGQITLPSAPTTGYCVGLAYRARFKSSRLGYAPDNTTAMLLQKKVAGIGFLLSDYVRTGVRFGAEFDNANRPLEYLPAIHTDDGDTHADVVLGVDPDEDTHPFPGDISLDSRYCIEANSPMPMTVRSIVVSLTT